MLRRKRSFWSLILLLAFLAASTALALEYKYVGSKNSLIYHYPTCTFAKMLKPENVVTFKSAREAQMAGYLPCRLCKPPFIKPQKER